MENENDTSDNAAEVADLKAKLAAAEQRISETANAVLAGVPEHLKPLVPTNLSAADQLAWFNQAKATGVFDKPAVLATDGGAKPTVTPVQADPSSLPVYARMAAGYRK